MLFVCGLWVIDEVEFADGFCYENFGVEQASAVHLSVHGSVTACALLHEFGEYTCVVCFFPFPAHMTEDALTLRASLPVRNDLSLVCVDVFLRDMVRLQFSGVERVQVVHCVAGEFRECGHRFWHRTALTNDEFVLANVYGFLFAYLVEVACTQNAVGHLSIVFLVERCFDACWYAPESAHKACVHMLAVVVAVPYAHRRVCTPSAVGGGVGGAPLAYAPLLACRDNLEILLYDPLVIACHALVHGFCHVLCLDSVAVGIVHAHVEFADAHEFA